MRYRQRLIGSTPSTIESLLVGSQISDSRDTIGHFQDLSWYGAGKWLLLVAPRGKLTDIPNRIDGTAEVEIRDRGIELII